MPPIKQTVSDDKNTEIPSWVYEKGLIFDYVAYLSDILGGYVSGSFNNSEAVISDDSLKGSSRASNYINRIGDILVYYGTKEDIAILKTLVTSLVRKVDRSRATPRSAARSGELFRDNLNSYSFHFQRYG